MSRRPPFEPLLFAKELEASLDYAKVDGLLAHWTGTHWAQLDTEEAQQDALRWIDSNSSAIASASAAVSAVRTALLWLNSLPQPQHDELLIPLLNGYLRYDAGRYVLDPHDRSKGVRYLINCAHDPLSPPPKLFMKLVETMLPDAEVRARVQEYLGYTLMPDTRFQRAAIWVGNGSNGKGTLARIAQALHRHVAAVNLDELSSFGLETPPAASLIYADEAPRTGLGEEAMKTLIAGELASIKRKYQTALSAEVKGKWLISANAVPRIQDRSNGFWRRMDIVPFNVSVDDADKDPLLAQKVIRDELPGVLNWFLEGLSRLLARGRFDPVKPMAMQREDDKAKAASNPIRAWVAEKEVGLGKAVETPKQAVYNAYVRWAEENNYKKENSGDFWDALKLVLGPIREGRAYHAAKRLRVCDVVL